VHGDQDRLVVVDEARRFVERLRAVSPSPVCYAELPRAQHGVDLFRSRRFDSVVDAVEAFAACVRSAGQASSAAAASGASERSRSTTCDATAPTATATSIATAEPVAPGFTVIT
jgi:dipeptidyl aminopeptidase/acylaminoacyl peptidase